ncbi:hypothetical protein, partial [Enterococcus sp. DIV1420a]|uniref:hypothetical protein n=1 Tax=Enterococcus sp. DIV1420a TaxID=2774672 RepID=UPI003F24D118
STTTPAETPAPKPVEATPVQPAEQPKSNQPASKEIPAELLLDEDVAKMWGVSRENGWIPTPYPMGSPELAGWLADNGYTGYWGHGTDFIQPYL